MQSDATKQQSLRVVFIINGENVPVEVLADAPLSEALARALCVSHNTGRPPNEWEIRNMAGKYFSPTLTAKQYGFSDDVRLFLSLPVAAGGATTFTPGSLPALARVGPRAGLAAR